MLAFFRTIKIDSIDNTNRRLIASKLIVFFAYTIAIILSILTFLQGNTKLFYTDIILLLLISIATLLLKRKNIYWVANSLLVIMSFGIVWGTYVNKGQDNVFYWGFLSVIFMMVSFGHKRGLIAATIFYTSLFVIMAQYISETLSLAGYVRFVVVSTMIVLTAYFYERSIFSSIEQLSILNEKLSCLTKTDSLTGLYNRRYFDEVFEEQFKIAKRCERFFVFAMIDVDFFKQYNDAYGHQSGDEVLKMIAKEIQKSLKRVNDYAFRLGGEEFGVCFNVEHQEDAKKLLEALRKNIEALPIEMTNASNVTVSVGFCVIPPCETVTQDTIYKASDDALYQAKHQGKNRVESAQILNFDSKKEA